MNQLSKLVLFLFFTSLFAACAQKKKTTAPFLKYEVECMGTEMDGSQMVKAYGKGKNKLDAIEQAKKVAIEAVLFKGVRSGEGCNPQPLIPNPNARKQNETYFNKFFSDGGIFQNFIYMGDSQDRYIEVKQSTSKEVVYGVVMTIKTTQLKDELIKKGIIEKEF